MVNIIMRYPPGSAKVPPPLYILLSPPRSISPYCSHLPTGALYYRGSRPYQPRLFLSLTPADPEKKFSSAIPPKARKNPKRFEKRGASLSRPRLVSPKSCCRCSPTSRYNSVWTSFKSTPMPPPPHNSLAQSRTAESPPTRAHITEICTGGPHPVVSKRYPPLSTARSYTRGLSVYRVIY